MPWQACYTDGTGYTACSGRGSSCLLPKVAAEPPGDFPGGLYFIRTSMTDEERKNIHDDLLDKLTDDVNKLIQEAEKRGPINILVSWLHLWAFFSDITARLLLLRNGSKRQL